MRDIHPVIRVAFDRIATDGVTECAERAVPEELPIAIEVNGFGYAVLMATGTHLEDLARGFILSERIVERGDQIMAVDAYFVNEDSAIVRVMVTQECAERIYERVRHRTSDSSCGLCGIENLEQAMRPLPSVSPTEPTAPDAIFRALEALRPLQMIGHATGATHAAALCDKDGSVLLVREDVGRHNAFDKLIGAMSLATTSWRGGFALLTSRCSYELVEKAVISGCRTLVTISAPTSLAINRAREAGLHLVVLARPDAILRLS